jgi:putative acetyltransferase
MESRAVSIRPERSEDHAAVDEIHRTAFAGAGARVVALVDALRREMTAGNSAGLVAEREGQLVGHVLFTRSLLDAPPRLVEVAVLSPISVLPADQRQGVGSSLIRAGLRVLAERSVPLVFVEGSPTYYARFGFVPGGSYGLRKPSLRIPDAAFQIARLAAYQPWMTGTLVYSHAFWDVDAVGLRDPDPA